MKFRRCRTIVRLREILHDMDLCQAHAADKMGVDRGHLNRVVNGCRSISVVRLDEALRKIGYKIEIVPVRRR